MADQTISVPRETDPKTAEVKVVPVEPTREMWAAGGNAVVGYKQRHHDKVVEDIWSAMLAASPPAEKGEGADDDDGDPVLPDTPLARTIYKHFVEVHMLSPDEAADSTGELLEALSAQPVSPSEGEVVAFDWTDEELIDLIGDAISDSMEMDWTSTDGAKAALAALQKEGLLRTDLPPHPASDQSDTERMRAFIKNVAASDWTETDLQYLAVNVRHSRGSLKLETKRDAASAALTLKAILIEARAALAEKAADK